MATGMIQQEMARPEGDELTTDSVKKNINMPPELQEAYERVVIAGMKVMFSKESHRAMLAEIQRGGPVAERLGKGISGLVLMLFQESNKTMPPEVIIPAGMELLMRAVDFLKDSGLEKVNNKDVGDAMEIMITTILKTFGIGPEQMQQMLNQASNETIPAAPQQMGA
jgi:hypothetical protein